MIFDFFFFGNTHTHPKHANQLTAGGVPGEINAKEHPEPSCEPVTTAKGIPEMHTFGNNVGNNVIKTGSYIQRMMHNSSYSWTGISDMIMWTTHAVQLHLQPVFNGCPWRVDKYMRR